MKQRIFKALANPARIFYVPYFVAVMNFVVQFLVFIAIFIFSLVTTNKAMNPLYFLISVCTVHIFLAGWSKKEPQLANIMFAKIQVIKAGIPRVLRK